VIAVLGAGQLGRMLALAGIPLGESFAFVHPQESASVRGLGQLVVAGYDDRARLGEIAARARVVTYEFESIPAEPVRWLAERAVVHPPPRALEVSQDRLLEKTFFGSLGIPTAEFAQVDDEASLEAAVAKIGLPAYLKTRRGGYDGKGQARLSTARDVAAAWRLLGGGAPLILEKHVAFEREVSILAVRAASGEVRVYPLVQNHHEGGILRTSYAPAPTPDAARALLLEAKAKDYAVRVLEELRYVGVLAIELFQSGDDLLANEMAPRVHNSGHWSIEGAQTSQFENHVRAILGMPLGATDAVGFSAMVNLIGALPSREDVLAIPGAHLHLYGKEPKPGRKVGHVTVRASSRAELDERVARVSRLVQGSSTSA
jgi:5-(carboxyamino)imidazole ribonucleotide synthase